MNQPSHNTCHTCRYSAPGEESNLQCRRYPKTASVILAPAPAQLIGGPPQLSLRAVAAWPIMAPGDWCGEWESGARIALQ